MSRTGFRIMQVFAGALAVAVGVAVIIGWQFDVPALKSVLPGMATMKVITAICFVLSGGSYLLLSRDEASSVSQWIARLLSAGTILAGVFTLLQHLLGWSLGIDQMLIVDTTTPPGSAPGRMAPNTAVAFIFLNCALLLLSAAPTSLRRLLIGVLSTVAALFGSFAVVGWLGSLALGYGWGELSTMALHTGALHALLGLGCVSRVCGDAGLRLALSRRLMAGAGMALLVFLLLGMVAYHSTRQLAETAAWVRHTHDVIEKLQSVHGRIIAVPSVIRGYLISGRRDFLTPYPEEIQGTARDLIALRQLTADNPRQQPRLQSLATLIARQRDLAEQTLDLYQREGRQAASDLVATGRSQKIVEQIVDLLRVLEKEERTLLLHRESETRMQTARAFFVLSVGCFLGLSLLLTILFFLNAEAEERRQAESSSRLAAEILKFTNDVVITAAPDGTVTSWNPGAEKIFGYSEREMLGRPVANLIPPAGVDEVRELMAKAAGGERVEGVETVYLHRDGRQLTVSLTVLPFRDRRDRLAGVVKILRDITERKQVEAALRSSEANFRTMANCMPQLAWIAHADGFIHWYNDRWYEFTGTTPAQMEGWGWQSVHDPDVLPQVMQGWTAAIAAGLPFEMEFPLRGADGQFRTFLTRVHPMKDAQGKVMQWFGTNTDVHQLKTMEKSLRDSQARLNSTLAAGSIGTWTWHLDEDLVTADDFTARMFSVDPVAASQGLPVGAYLDALVEQDRPTVVAALQQTLQTASPYEVEYRVNSSAGELVWLQAKGRLEGRALQGAVVDITGRKKNEEYFRLLNALAEAARTLTDPQEILTLMAGLIGAHLHASRCTYADVEPDGQHFNIQYDYTDNVPSVVGRYPRAAFGPRAVSMLQSGQTLVIRNVDLELSPETGRDRFASLGIQAIITCPLIKDGKLRAMMAVHQNTPRDWTPGEITIVEDAVERCWATLERRNAEESLRRLNADLEHRVQERTAQLAAANQAKTVFLSTMSHEIRTPMNAILGYSQLMLRDPHLGAEAKANLQIINRSGEHLLSLLNDILDMSKIEAGRTELSLKTFGLARLLDDIAGMFRQRAEAKALHFEITVDGAFLPYVVGDEGKMRQVLINLLGNAVKFTRQGSIKLHVVQKEITPGGPLWLRARVEDTGPGISDSEQGILFQPFSQAKRGLHSQEGTGLGLAISRAYARIMGGDLTVTSRVGAGSVFTFEIPIDRGVTQVAIRNLRPRRVTRLRAGQEVPRILVADDLLENRDWLLKLLRFLGFVVESADNGEAAVRVWQEWHPNLILMDVHMPVLDGLQATTTIKALPGGAETVIIALTASALDEQRRSAFEHGVDDFITKPCDENELLEKLRRHLNLVFDYDEQGPPARKAPALPVTADSLAQVPSKLLEQLREATLHGNKRLMDNLISQVAQLGHPESAETLRRLANEYAYDALVQLLERHTLLPG